MPVSPLWRRLTASILVCALASLSAGLAPYQAVAAELQGRGEAAPASLSAAPALPAAAALPQGPMTAPEIGVPASLPGAPAATSAAASAEPGAAAASAEVSAASRGVGERLQALGEVSSAPEGQAREAGESIQSLLSGRRLPLSEDEGAAVAAPEMAGMAGAAAMSSEPLYLAQPAGQDSIGAQAQSMFGNGPRAPQPPTPPTPPQGPQGPRGEDPQPLVGRVASSLVALVPAVALGWPLLAAGSVLAGSLVVASILGLAAVPFFGERTPAFLRGLPGTVLGALGAVTLYAGVTAAAWPTALMGGIVLLGGWGFRRFGLNPERRGGSAEVVETLLGGLGAAAGAGLVLLSPAGWWFTGLTIASGVAALVLFMHLPSFVGAGMRAAADAVYLSVQDGVRVALSISRDTTLRKRLEAWTKAHTDKSGWNALWLGLLVWLPLGLVELGKTVLGAASGLVQGAARAIPMFLWGAAHELAPQGRVDRFMFRWTRTAFGLQKSRGFNAEESRWLDAANSDSFLERLGAGLVITTGQVLWLVASAVATTVLSLLGWVRAFIQPLPAGEQVADPRYYKLDRDALADRPMPAVPTPDVHPFGVVAARGMATAIAAAPLALMGLSLWGAGFEGMGAVLALAGVTLMPLMPAGDFVPSWARKLPGWLMSGTAALTLYYGIQAALVGLPTGWILPLAGLALLGGFGFSSMIETLRDEKTKTWQTDSGWYIGGFGAGLALLSALGAAMLGLTGIVPTALSVVAVILSPLLLYHLGRPFWHGVRYAAGSFIEPMSKAHDVLTFWDHEGRLGDNLRAWRGFYLRKSALNGGIVLVPFLVEVIVRVADGLISLAAGLAVWPFRVFPAFMQGRAEARSWNSPQARFWQGFRKFLVDGAEGSKKTAFDPLVAKLLPAMAEKDARTSWPTLKAFGAFALSLVAQAVWLARLAVWLALTPLWMIGAYFAGVDARDAQPK